MCFKTLIKYNNKLNISGIIQNCNDFNHKLKKYHRNILMIGTLRSRKSFNHVNKLKELCKNAYRIRQ